MKNQYIKTKSGEVAELPIRYCCLGISYGRDCPSSWGSIDSCGVKSCADDPMEKNCQHIIRDAKLTPCVRVELLTTTNKEVTNEHRNHQ